MQTAATKHCIRVDFQTDVIYHRSSDALSTVMNTRAEQLPSLPATAEGIRIVNARPDH